MKKIVNMCTLAVLILVSALMLFGQKPDELAPIRSVDISRYSGRWYEIAKYPNKFQKDCYSNTTAVYSSKPNGRIKVLNECRQKDGSTKSATAEGKIVDETTNAKLKVRFAPGFLSFLPFVWANYWIIDLGPDYEFAVVGEPNRKYLWILSRTPELADENYRQILERLETKGYDPGRPVKTVQAVETEGTQRVSQIDDQL